MSLVCRLTDLEASLTKLLGARREGKKLVAAGGAGTLDQGEATYVKAKEDSWIWRTNPVGQGKMTEQEVEEWFQKGK